MDSTEATAVLNHKRLARVPRTAMLGATILLASFGGYWLYNYETRGKFYQESDDATVEADMVTVSPKVTGYVAEVFVTDNQDVAAGQPLLRIEARTYKAHAAQAQAQILQASASIDGAQASIKQQQAAIEQARAQLASARDRAAHDAAQVARYAPLAAAGAETGEQLAQLRTSARQSAEDVRALEAALTVQQRRIAGIEAQVLQNRAQNLGAQAQLNVAEDDLGSTIIRAPFAGRIGDKTVQVGQLAQPGVRMMSIVPLDKMYVVANFKETQLALMRAGQPATITVDAFPGLKLAGRLASLSPGTGAQFSLLPPQNATGNFTKIVQRVPTRIALEASPEVRRLLVPGLSVTASVDTISARGDLQRLDRQQTHLDRKAR